MDDPTKAFEELVARYQGVVCAVAFSVLRDRARSEEVAQEAFLIAWQKLPAMDPAPKLPAWVCGIARNLAANAARRKKEMLMEAETATTDRNALDLMLDREREDLAARALADLGDREREAVVLYYRGATSFADVATTLGITEAAARQRVHRGRERLKSSLAAVEAALRATKPSHAFTAACVAALAAGSATSASAATATATTMPADSATGATPESAAGSKLDSTTRASSDSAAGAAKSTKKIWIAAPIAAALIGGGAAVIVSSTSSSSSSSPSTGSSSSSSEASLAPSATDGTRLAKLDSVYIRRIDAAARSALIDKLRDAQRTRAGAERSEIDGSASIAGKQPRVYDFSGGGLVDTSKPPPDPTRLDKKSIRYAIHDTGPLLLECYGTAFDRLARKDGTLEVKLVLVGEPGLATIIDDVELGGDAHLTRDPQFVECMRETLFSIEMPPMPAAETWNVHYPLTMPGKR